MSYSSHILVECFQFTRVAITVRVLKMSHSNWKKKPIWKVITQIQSIFYKRSAYIPATAILRNWHTLTCIYKKNCGLFIYINRPHNDNELFIHINRPFS